MSTFLADCDHVRVNTLAMEIVGTQTRRGHLVALSYGQCGKLAKLARKALAALDRANTGRRAEIAAIETRNGW